jgi:FkbM family methyltransferase
MMRRLLARSLRTYTFNAPFARGRYRIMKIAQRLNDRWPDSAIVTTRPGFRIKAPSHSATYESIFFLGTYEDVITRLLQRLTRPTDICFDIGANIGWYTLLFSTLTKANEFRPNVHAFEPVTHSFEALQNNVCLNDLKGRVALNKVALTESNGTERIYVFPDLPEGHSSLAPMAATSARSETVVAMTLDDYLEQSRIPRIDIMKVDIEGAELLMLRGADSIFDEDTCPIMIMEMAVGTAERFGYHPNDIISHISARVPYRFYELHDHNGTLTAFESFPPGHIGANVLAIPQRMLLGQARDFSFLPR